MNTDSYGEIINGDDTFSHVAQELTVHHSCLIGWTDENSTHYDILFTLEPRVWGNVQGGISGMLHLYVSIMRIGVFGFKLGKESSTDYYMEKLFIQSKSTGEKLTELINNIRMISIN